MVNDPYSVLGISRDATPEEIKKAYRTQAKKYHPDLHPDDPVAAQKMNEVNEAYDMLTNPEKYEKRRAQEQAYSQRQSSSQGYGYNGYSNGYQNNNNQQGPGGWSSNYWGFDFSDFFGFANAQRFDTRPKPENGDTVELVRAISAVNAGRFQEAVDILSKMTSVYRNARWYYVCAVAYEGMEEYEQAESMIERAMRLDTQNQVYAYLYRQIRSEARQESETYYRRGQASPFGSLRSILFFIIIINLLMMFMGGGRGCFYMLPFLCL